MIPGPRSPLQETAEAGWPLAIYLRLALSGFVIVSHKRLQASVRRLRWLSLAMGLILVGLMIWLYGLGDGPAFGTPRSIAALGCRGLGSWCCILAILGFGIKHLDFSTPFLKYANQAVLPVYILHQTVLVAVGYLVVQWAIPSLLRWVVLLLASLSLIKLTYELLVRRFNVMRILFGMKRRTEPTALRSGKTLLARPE